MLKSCPVITVSIRNIFKFNLQNCENHKLLL